MRAGRLNKRITIQELINITPSEVGEPTQMWVEKYPVWASIIPERSTETFNGQSLSGKITHRIMIRYRPGIRHSDRIVYGDRVFDIESIINTVEGNKNVIFSCVERL